MNAFLVNISGGAVTQVESIFVNKADAVARKDLLNTNFPGKYEVNDITLETFKKINYAVVNV
jgi:hypothetical protein